MFYLWKLFDCVFLLFRLIKCKCFVLILYICIKYIEEKCIYVCVYFLFVNIIFNLIYEGFSGC